MPRRKKQENGEHHDEPQQLFNSGARAETIRAAVRYIADLEEEIKAIRADIKTYKQTHIKDDLGFKLSDWTTLYRIYKLEADDRDKLLDTLREGFGALGIGEQLDWIKAAEAVAEAVQ